MEKICEGTYTSAISRRLRLIERHHRVKDPGGFLPNTPFILLILILDIAQAGSRDAISRNRHQADQRIYDHR